MAPPNRFAEDLNRLIFKNKVVLRAKAKIPNDRYSPFGKWPYPKKGGATFRILIIPTNVGSGGFKNLGDFIIPKSTRLV